MLQNLHINIPISMQSNVSPITADKKLYRNTRLSIAWYRPSKVSFVCESEHDCVTRNSKYTFTGLVEKNITHNMGKRMAKKMILMQVNCLSLISSIPPRLR